MLSTLDRDKLENAPSYASTESRIGRTAHSPIVSNQYWRNDRTAGLASDETDRLISSEKVEAPPSIIRKVSASQGAPF